MRTISVLFLAPLLLVAAEVRVADDFSGYADRSAAGEGWETDGVAWQARNGRFASDWIGAAEAFPRDRRIFPAATVEGVVIPRRATGTEWKIAGLGLRVDARNFWHLALVEGPDKDGKRHFVELTEMRDGQWLAQSNLKTVRHTGSELAWAYGTPTACA